MVSNNSNQDKRIKGQMEKQRFEEKSQKQQKVITKMTKTSMLNQPK